MATVPTGTKFFIATVIAALKATTVVTNAAAAVVTSAAHGYGVGDIVEITSGWGRLNKRVFRISAADANTFTLEGANTTSLSFFPAGTGIGSVRKVTTFTQVTGIMNPQTSGGEPKTVKYKYTEDDSENSINDGFTATDYSFEVDADKIGSAGYEALKTLTDVQTDTILKIEARSGSLQFQPCTAALNEAVNMGEGKINTCKATFNGNNRLTRYAA